MKFKNSFIILLLVSLALSAVGQDNRTTQTRVADVLALFPAKTSVDADRLFRDLIGMNDEGLALIASRVLPNGKEEGVSARYAVSLLTHHAATTGEKARIERTYLDALNRSDNTEVKAYFIDNLKVIGSNASVAPLTSRINEDGLTQQAISALVSIGTSEARSALQSSLTGSHPQAATARLIQALGELKHLPSVSTITPYASGSDVVVRQHALWSLALIADAASQNVLLQQAKSVNFKHHPSEATEALVEYVYQLSRKGNSALAAQLSQETLSNTLEGDQQHFRLAALKVIAQAQPVKSTKTLVKELSRFDAEFQREVLKIAGNYVKNEAVARQWQKVYRKNSALQPEILAMLAQSNRTDAFADATLIPALKSGNRDLRIAATEEIAYSENKKYQAPLIDYLLRSTDDAEIAAAKTALLRMMGSGDAKTVAPLISNAQPKNKAALIDILGERRVYEHFDAIVENTTSQDTAVRAAAFTALPKVSSAANTAALLDLLDDGISSDEAKAVQAALIAAIDKSSYRLINEAYAKNKARILPLIPYVNDDNALAKVNDAFRSGTQEEKAAAFEALLDWQDHAAAQTLLAVRRDPALAQYHERAFRAFVSQVSNSTLPDEQKLLMLDAAMAVAKTTNEKSAIIRAVGSLRNFSALIFVSQYLDDEELNRAASRSAMQIALPTADARPGLTGVIVRNTLQKILDKLDGKDSQYEVIDIQTYMENMPYTKGFEPIFNGVDLSGWQGLVENPIARSKMSKAELVKKQRLADEKLKESWSVKDGAIYFTGKGDNLCTMRPYGDFEMLVDWKISRDGDSGIYLRGSPQVQVWDPWGKSDLARVGSGGLFNNKENASDPLVVADNPIGEWNTFHIKMTGEKVTVHLNGILVVDNVTMENYWDRSIPIFPEEAIELQAHGNELAFRNIYVKELGARPYELTEEEKHEGFELLFNGKDLDNWVGNKTDYVVEDDAIAIYPKGNGHGNMYTEKEYSDFIVRFQFQLTPGANNGLGIHAPLTGDVAYQGKEIQILDDTAPVYANLEQYQYHGSVYGLVPAKRGYQKPVGQWNEQEVYVNGDHIKVTLNGTVIVDADLKKATLKGTLDGKKHPGLNVHRGHIGFLGHGTIVRFRNIRVKELE